MYPQSSSSEQGHGRSRVLERVTSIIKNRKHNHQSYSTLSLPSGAHRAEGTPLGEGRTKYEMDSSHSVFSFAGLEVKQQSLRQLLWFPVSCVLEGVLLKYL